MDGKNEECLENHSLGKLDTSFGVDGGPELVAKSLPTRLFANLLVFNCVYVRQVRLGNPDEPGLMASSGIRGRESLRRLQSRRAVAFAGLAPDGILLDFRTFPKPSGGGGTLASGISSPPLLHPVVRPRQVEANRAQRRATTRRGGFMGEVSRGILGAVCGECRLSWQRGRNDNLRIAEDAGEGV